MTFIIIIIIIRIHPADKLINWLFQLNVTQFTSDKGYLCATDKEGFSTGKRCFLVSFIDGVGEKERNSTKNKPNLQGLFYLLARPFYILLDVVLFLCLSITAYRTFSLAWAARYIYLLAWLICLPSKKVMIDLPYTTKSFLLLNSSVNIKLMSFLS